MAGDAEQRIEAYLSRLRERLRGMNQDEVREIVEELRGHIIDKVASAGISGELTAAGVDAALAQLGSPDKLAREYLTDSLLARAEVTRTPFGILKSVFHWASLSVAGFWVLIGSTVGYFFGVVFILVGALKLIHPHTAGLWAFPKGNGDVEWAIRLGFGNVPANGREVLGWWIVPIGWIGGWGLVMLTTYIALWAVRLYRASRKLDRE